jgi:hypothetical protein
MSSPMLCTDHCAQAGRILVLEIAPFTAPGPLALQYHHPGQRSLTTLNDPLAQHGIGIYGVQACAARVDLSVLRILVDIQIIYHYDYIERSN